MLRSLFCVISFLLILGTLSSLHAQDRKKLEREKAKLERELSDINKILSQTQKSRTLSTSNLNVLKKKIKTREILVSNISSQLNILDSEILSTQESVTQLSQKIALLKNEYAQMLQLSYRYRTATDKLLFIFKSKDFNQAWQRYAFFKQYSQKQKEILIQIEEQQQELKKRTNELSVKKISQQELLSQEVKHKENLTREEKKKQEELKGLQKKERQLRQQEQEKKRRRKQVDKQIDNLIQQEVKRQQELAKKRKAAAGKKGGQKIEDTPEKALSRTFAQNKGKLPWPVEKGVITGKYGVQNHPELKGIQIENYGIDIRTVANAQARAVFDGEVVRTFTLSTKKEGVLIRHGDYFSVYINLEKTFVKIGTKVTTKQAIGVVAQNSEKVYELKFQIWKGTEKLNPGLWIAR